MRFHLLSLLAALTPYVAADVSFTVPAAGATIASPSFTITWADSGTAPLISTLTTYSLQLMVGGNSAADSTPLMTLGTGAVSALSLAAVVSPLTLAGPTANGFYLAMTSTSSAGGTIINYSDRFTLSFMTGTTSAADVAAVAGLAADAVPAAVNDVAAAAAATTAAAAEGGSFTVPYNLQEGDIKYAPMQPVPPTKITAKNATPLFPTSAYTVAKTYLGLPSITLTVTASQTFSVQSMENTAAAAAQPSSDGSDDSAGSPAMARFLARWKD